MRANIATSCTQRRALLRPFLLEKTNREGGAAERSDSVSRAGAPKEHSCGVKLLKVSAMGGATGQRFLSESTTLAAVHPNARR